MLEGPIASALKIKDEDQSLNRILLILMKTVSRINDEAMFAVIYELIRKIVQGKKCGGNAEILDACQGEVKGNKYAVLCAAEVLAGLYSQKDFDESATIKNIVKEFESLHAKSLAKIVTNIENYLASAAVLVFVQGINLDELNTTIFVNERNFLSNPGYLRDLFTRIAIRQLSNYPLETHPNPLPLSIFLGITASKSLKLTLLEKLPTIALFRLLSEGVYPYYLYNINKQFPVHYEHARKLVHTVFKYC